MERNPVLHWRNDFHHSVKKDESNLMARVLYFLLKWWKWWISQQRFPLTERHLMGLLVWIRRSQPNKSGFRERKKMNCKCQITRNIGTRAFALLQMYRILCVASLLFFLWFDCELYEPKVHFKFIIQLIHSIIHINQSFINNIFC